MESPSVPEGCQVVAQEDSTSVDQQELPTSPSESDHVEKIVPNAQAENAVQERTLSQDNPVKFHEPDFTYLEITSRLSREECDGSATGSKVPAIPGRSLSSTDNPEATCSANQHYDSSGSNFADHKALEDKESVMYDDNLFSDEALATSSSESTPSRKRQAGDFLPINAEIKRIGVEISEEHAKQLKNDIRRLSPVLVSLRERTLGEISLTSDSGLFEDNDQALRLEIIEDNVAPLFTGSCAQPEEVEVQPPAKFTPAIDCATQQSSSVLTGHSCASNSSENAFSTSSRIIEHGEISPRSKTPEPKLEKDPAQCLENGHQLESPNSPAAPTELNACSTPTERSDARRELMIVLSRVDHETLEAGPGIKRSPTQQFIDDSRGEALSGAQTIGDRPLAPSIESPVEGKDDSEVVKKCGADGFRDVIAEEKVDSCLLGVCSSGTEQRTSANSVVLVGDICLSPKYLDNDQLRRKSPKVVIERTLEDAAGAKLSTDGKVDCSEEMLLRANLDCVRRTLEDTLNDDEEDEDDVSASDSLAVGEDHPRAAPSSDVIADDVQESLDTETETETCSDNSEIAPIASIHSRDCVEPTNDGSTCPENDSIVSDEVPTGVITRLQPERPEAFTEDSAESLALATGARDEVRSDGSDSGLGSELPSDPGPAPAPESDSETSFLDRIPDDILSDKDKVVNPLEAFVPDPGTSGIQQHHQEIHQQPVPLPRFLTPAKSSLKRRLTDCMEGEPSPKRISTDDPMRKKRNIQFDAVTVYYFPRAQGFTCVPSQGGSTLGMSATHTHAERFSLTEHAAEQRRLHRARLAQLRSERAANCVTEAASSSEDPSDDTDEEPSDTEELDIDSYYFLQPVPTWQRRALLRAAGVRRIDAVEKDDCRDIRASREHCGCGCKGYCDPESCPCSRANVKCQVDRAGFPCGCSRDGCANSSGRIEFNPVRVRTHFIHTLMRLQLEKKQRDEDRTDHDILMNNPIGCGPIREAPGLMGTTLGPMDHPNVITGDPVSCVSTGGFTTLHYETHDQSSAPCQPGIVHAPREDSLDLYAIRDDCYPPDDVDAGPSSQRKLHPEFGQAFQTFPGQQPTVSFPQSAYQDYQGYQTLASTSRSQFQPQFQPVSPVNATFSHYTYGQDPGVMQPPCQSHPPVPSHHPSVYEAGFPQEDPAGTQQQYTNLNSVQPLNSVVQQMGKLEPFSELLAGRYSYYGDPEPQPIPVGYHSNGGNKMEPEKLPPADEQPVEPTPDDCDENFGEIIKKSMVETVSA